jgi:hypothetical protein
MVDTDGLAGISKNVDQGGVAFACDELWEPCN